MFSCVIVELCRGKVISRLSTFLVQKYVYLLNKSSIPSHCLEVERGSTNPISLFVVGNKLDLENARAVTYKEGAQYAEQIGAAFHETSALNGEGIQKVIIALAEHLLERQIAQNAPAIHLTSDSSDGTSNHKQWKFCCSSG